MKKLMITFFALFCFVFSNTVFSQHEEEHHAVSDDHHEDSHSGGHAHKNHMAVFTGATNNITHHSTGFTIGIDYEYRISNLIGLGLGGEYISIGSGEILGSIPIFIHPMNNMKIVTAPLVIFAEEHHDDEHHESTGKEASFAFRIGGGYDFHLGKVVFGPTVNFDIGSSKALVFGLSIGFGF
ncbi:MAG: hypothetical protein KAS71_15980 [Bacteroidales bacterium]|nr:hypothetical protein [Bacteroidales bacterium]